MHGPLRLTMLDRITSSVTEPDSLRWIDSGPTIAVQSVCFRYWILCEVFSVILRAIYLTFCNLLFFIFRCGWMTPNNAVEISQWVAYYDRWTAEPLGISVTWPTWLRTRTSSVMTGAWQSGTEENGRKTMRCSCSSHRHLQYNGPWIASRYQLYGDGLFCNLTERIQCIKCPQFEQTIFT